MLEKESGDPKINRLRNIVIVKGDLNATLQVIWNYQLVPAIEASEMIHPTQCGNRKGHTALDALLAK
eukprot:12037803-Ditylum_brightwellii.AAC.2